MTLHLEVLVEEQSAEHALSIVLPQLLGSQGTFAIHAFQGKQDLLRRLPERLRGYASWIDMAVTRVLVLVDEDRQDCLVLKAQLEDAARRAGLSTRATAVAGEPFAVLNRIAVEELEAWFFGDPDALRSAYPRVPAGLERRARFRSPDQIPGGTSQALAKVLQDAGYHRGGLRKISAAREIAAHMDLARNTSPSCRCFCEGVLEIIRSAP